jgi:hypothetical protein
MDVNALDLAGVEDAAVAAELELAAADNLKRVLRPAEEDFTATPSLTRMLGLLETKTVWHPVGV